MTVLRPADLHGRKIAVVVVEEGADSAGEAWVVLGTGHAAAGALTIGVDGGGAIPVPPAWLPRIRKVTADVKDLVDQGEYFLVLRASELPEAAEGAVTAGKGA
jgi:hypothetical protein